MLQLFKDALYLAKKRNYKINVFEFMPQSHQITRREVKSIDSEIIETENNGFDRGDREIRDWQIIRNRGLEVGRKSNKRYRDSAQKRGTGKM